MFVMNKNKIKVLCYGASVTAQKDASGYVQQLIDLLPNNKFDVAKIGRGASHFEYAGFGFSREIEAHNPDILIVDWLTPSMKSFSQNKIDIFNEHFISLGIHIIWVNFPRKDDLKNERPCFRQVNNSCQKYGITFLDINSHIMHDPDKYLRDSVHTTQEGAVLYAELLAQAVHNAISSSTPIYTLKHVLPSINKVSATVSLNSPFCIELDGTSNSLEILIECFIGPNTPMLNVRAFGDERIGEVEELTVNPVDPWCYYTRKMVLPIILVKLKSKIKKIELSVGEGDPFENVVLNKEIKEKVGSKKCLELTNIVTYSTDK